MNRTLRKFLLVVFGSVFLFSGVMVLKYHLETRAGTEYTEALVQAAVVPNDARMEDKAEAAPDDARTVDEAAVVPDEARTEDEAAEASSGTVPAESVEKAGAESSDGVFAQAETETGDAPVRIAPIQVDFDVLRAQNQDVAAWIYCPDTPINYPVAQASDNEYYLHRLLNGKENYAGTLFMDYRNAEDMSDWNCVIYGHNMKNNSMFGTLTNYKQQSYFESHPEIFLLTPECDYVISVMAGFVTSADSGIYNAFCPDDEEKARLVEQWLDASDFVSECRPAGEDRLVTLSTCSYEYGDARYVVVGILEELGRQPQDADESFF